MDERLVIRWGIGLLTFRWLATIFYILNNNFLNYYGALIGYYNSDTSNYHYSLIILLIILYSTPHLLIAIILLERRKKRYPNFSGMTEYAVYYIIQVISSTLNTILIFYVNQELSGNFSNFTLILFNLAILVTLGFTIMMMITIFSLPKDPLFVKIKFTFVCWIGFTTVSIFQPVYFERDNILVRSIYLTILQSIEILFLWFVTRFLMIEHMRE